MHSFQNLYILECIKGASDKTCISAVLKKETYEKDMGFHDGNLNIGNGSLFKHYLKK